MTRDALTTAVAVLAAVSVLTLVLSVLALRSASTKRRAAKASRLPTDVRGLRAEVEALRQEVAGAVRRLAVVRYDAFGDMGGRLSWSMAVLRSEEHTSELQSRQYLVCRLLLEKKKKHIYTTIR